MEQSEHSKSFFYTSFNFDEQNGNANPFCRHMISFLSPALWGICFSVIQPLFPSPSEVHTMLFFSQGPRVNKISQPSNSWNTSDTETGKGSIKVDSYLSILFLCLQANKQTNKWVKSVQYCRRNQSKILAWI